MKRTVLLVDDDVEVISTFSSWLSLEGYGVRTATDGEAALGEVRDVDAIILDARMPILDGLGFLREVRARNSCVPVAVVTGDYLIDEAVVKEFVTLNAQLVYKPLWVDDLMTLTRGLVEQSSPR